MKSKNNKRSPLKDKPLRHAGQALDEQIDDKAINLVMSWVVFPGIAIIFAALEWIRYLHPIPAQPIPITVFAIILVIISIFKITKGVREIRTLRMGSDGEKLVAEELLELVKQGSAILNDVQGDKFNIDHVVISTHGIYLIETKTYSKPIKKESTISFDSENVFVDGRVVDRRPIRQAKALSKWLQELLQKSTGENFCPASYLISRLVC